ncbi:hypothetical protein PQX77_016095 [Marasmius sp. AFHP31]|nr:hypothetical protein PQX77_016095 [Marasmius sp. AFHP31]
MPPEPKAKLKRRSSKRELESEYKFDGGHARELEIKRSRVLIVLLTSCRRSQLCRMSEAEDQVRQADSLYIMPEAAHPYVLMEVLRRAKEPATEHLHRRISKLSGRIRELEDALAAIHGKHSTQPHPLLDQSLIEATAEEDEGFEKAQVTVSEEASDKTSGGGDPIDAFGTLSISDHGISRFFGPTGGSESLLMSNLGSERASSSPTTQSRSAFRNSASPNGKDRDPSSVSPTSTSNSFFSAPSTATAFSSGGNVEAELSATFTLFSRAFPFTPLGLPLSEVHSLIRSHLPPRETALELVQIFFDQISWLFRGLTREQVFEDMIPAIYGSRQLYGHGHEDGSEDVTMGKGPGNLQEDHGANPEEEWNGPHSLALLFIVFALGALVRSDEKDSGRPPIDRHEEPDTKDTQGSDDVKTSKYHQVPPIVEHYHQLSRAALSLQPILEKPSAVTIQALHLLSIYNAMSGDGDDRLGKGESGMEMTWSLITLCSHLSMTIGLHRDSARWGLTHKMVQRRRILFWDMFVADVWTSLSTGRPPAFSLAYIDCSFPQYDADNCSTKGKPEDQAFELWQFRFAAEVVADISARTLTAEAPTYATIMELDRKVREFPLPDIFIEKDTNRRMSPDEDVTLALQKCVIEHIKETMLIYIHRSFFAQAIIEQPVNPLKSSYAPSFLAAYRASGTILKSVREQFAVFPIGAGRYWSMWTFAFSAAVIFGTVVTRGPRSPLAQSAMLELDQACILFSKAAVYSVRASKALDVWRTGQPILVKLREKAQCALASVRNNTSPLSGDNGGLLWNLKNEDPADELSIFAGHTRFVSARQKSPGQVDSPPSSDTGAQVRMTPDPPLHNNNHSSGDVAMETDNHPYDSYRIPRTQQQQPPPYRAPPPPALPQVRLTQLPNLPSPSPTSGMSPISTGWRADDGSGGGGDYSRQRQYTEPPTIAIPPATQTPPRSHPQQQPPQQPVHYGGYSYDRDRGTGRSNHSDEYSWSSQQQQQQQQYPPPAPDHASIRLSHPQYMQPQGQIYRSSAPQEMYNPPPPPQGLGGGPYHVYGTSQTGPGPGPGNAHLAGLGLAARDSRLDERWSSFMQDSGLLDDVSSYSRGQR